jgi:hypothetical protein
MKNIPMMSIWCQVAFGTLFSGYILEWRGRAKIFIESTGAKY